MVHIKELWRSIRFPRGKELVVLVCMVAAYMLASTFTLNGDGSYGYAMTIRRMDPEAFADNDLGVMGSLKGNFILYDLLYYVPGFARNFPLADVLISFPIGLLLLLAWYNIFLEITKNKWVTVASLFLMLFVGERFAIGGSTIPLFYLSPVSSVLFAQTWALFFFLKKKPVFSIVIASLTTYLHPPSGIFFMCVFALLMLYDAWKTKQYRQVITGILSAGILFLPNIFLALHRIGPVIDAEKFFRLFYSLNGYWFGHIYIQSYPDAYAFTLSAWFFLLYLKKQKQFTSLAYTAILFRFFIAAFLLVGIWLVNVYVVHHVQFFYLYFASRATYIIKPLFILLFTVVGWNLYQKKTLTSVGAAGTLVASLIVPSHRVGLALLLLCAFYFLFHIEQVCAGARWNTTLLRDESARGVSRRRLLMIPPLIVAVIVLGMFEHKFNNKLHKVYRLLHGENLFNFSFDIEKNYGLTKAHPTFGGVLDWAKQYKGKMFIIPPNNCMFSGAFRFITKNSIYVNTCDLFQLSYIPEYFFAAYDRLLELNFTVLGFGVFDWSRYNLLDLEYLKTKDADFAIFDKTAPGYYERAEKPVYENNQYIIYALR